MSDIKRVEIDGLTYAYLVETGEIFGEESNGSSGPTESDLESRARSVEPPPGQFESEKVSLKTLSMSVIGECNLGCTYCYVFEDHTPNPVALKMTETEALRQVDWLLDQAGDTPRVTVTYFGGEPFMNFSVLKASAAHARKRGAELGKEVGFTITTNGTLLSDEAIDFLHTYDVQTTISLDGDKEMNDLRRHWVGNEKGSYDSIVPKVKKLLERFRDRPFKVGARATMTHGNADVERIVDHLLEMGFHEVATSVASVEKPGLKFDDGDYAEMNAGLRRLAHKFADEAIQGRHFGFSNVASVVKRFHEGSVRNYPCGATIGLAGSDPQGNLYVCHRFIGDERYRIGTVDDGVDHDYRNKFINSNNVQMKDYCSPCWLRYLCGGGCYHEAMVSGSRDFSKLTHICNHLRDFYEACLEAYIRIATENPDYLSRLDPQIQKHVHDSPKLAN